jgi:hypothetical protein
MLIRPKKRKNVIIGDKFGWLIFEVKLNLFYILISKHFSFLKKNPEKFYFLQKKITNYF